MLRQIRSLQTLLVFEAAGRQRSLKLAAAELHVTPSAVSRQIRALEEDLGVRLFRRLHRGLELTAEGSAYLAEVSIALAHLERATQSLRARRDAQPLRLSVLPSFAGNWLVPRLPAFEAAHPGIDVRMEATTAYADFRRDPIDLAIRFGRGPWPGVQSEPLVALAFFPVCRPGLRDGVPPLRRPCDLAAHTWLEEIHVPDAWPTWLRAAGVEGIRPPRTLQYDNAQLMLEAAMAGQGIALATAVIAERYLHDGRLVRPFRESVASALTYHLVGRAEDADQPHIQAFRRWLHAEMQAWQARAIPTPECVARNRRCERIVCQAHTATRSVRGMEQLTVVEGRLEWRDVPAPRIEDAQQAIVRPLAVARCDIDLPYVSGMLPVPRPFAVGHECVGEIIDVGTRVTRFSVGQRVIVPFQISCGECHRCRRGFTGSCAGVPFLSAYGMPLNDQEWGGALSDGIRVPFADAMLVPAPDNVPAWSLAAAADNASDGWRCVAPHLAAQPGAPVLIVAGIVRSIAAYAADAALALGSERVDFVSQDTELLAIAERLGAHAIEAPFAGTRGPYPITVDGSGDPAGLRMALRSTEPEGVCVSPAYYPFDETPIPLGRMYTKGIVFHTGRCHARSVLPEVAAAIAAGRLHPDRITTRRATWAEARESMVEPGVKLVVERTPG